MTALLLVRERKGKSGRTGSVPIFWTGHSGDRQVLELLPQFVEPTVQPVVEHLDLFEQSAMVFVARFEARVMCQLLLE
ncbi:MAG: hypothetical protein ABIR62_16410 [Dokdonella sp.]|uniref:hypothetical protein n=1 Tax=Dokdonella sp. TaxID=2291710 RepID=UPI0032669BF2